MVEGTAIDVAVHSITLFVAIGLFLVSLRAYRRKDTTRFAYVAGAFGVFMVKEALTLVNVLYAPFGTLTALIHLLNLLILGLFFYGVVR